MKTKNEMNLSWLVVEELAVQNPFRRRTKMAKPRLAYSMGVLNHYSPGVRDRGGGGRTGNCCDPVIETRSIAVSSSSSTIRSFSLYMSNFSPYPIRNRTVPGHWQLRKSPNLPLLVPAMPNMAICTQSGLANRTLTDSDPIVMPCMLRAARADSPLPKMSHISAASNLKKQGFTIKTSIDLMKTRIHYKNVNLLDDQGVYLNKDSLYRTSTYLMIKGWISNCCNFESTASIRSAGNVGWPSKETRTVPSGGPIQLHQRLNDNNREENQTLSLHRTLAVTVDHPLYAATARISHQLVDDRRSSTRLVHSVSIEHPRVVWPARESDLSRPEIDIFSEVS